MSATEEEAEAGDRGSGVLGLAGVPRSAVAMQGLESGGKAIGQFGVWRLGRGWGMIGDRVDGLYQVMDHLAFCCER